MHRFGLDGMLQGCGGNLKHLQNRSPSSLHGKQHKLTKSPLVVLHFYNLLQCFAWPAQEAINMCRSPLPSYKSWLCKNWASETWSSGWSPVQIFDLTHRLCALASQLQAKFIIFRFVTFQTFQHQMLPSFRSVWRLLQHKGPSVSRLSSSTMLIRFWVLSTMRRLRLFAAMDASEKPNPA